MSKKKACVKCGRSIDEMARACLYCNWWQSEPVPAQTQPAPAVDYVPPPDNRARNKLIGIIGFAVLLVVAFVIGAFVHGADAMKAAQPRDLAAKSSTTEPEQRTTVTLVPVTEGVPPSVLEPPVTSIASNGASTASATNDATALPSDQYAAATERVRTAPRTGTVVDPRSITGTVDSTTSRPARPRPRPIHIAQTQPVPLFQPVPHVRIDREATAQLYLTVGTDGRVHDIDVKRAVPGVMGPLVGEVQNWRFRPATENGTPVASRFSVAVTFRP